LGDQHLQPPGSNEKKGHPERKLIRREGGGGRRRRYAEHLWGQGGGGRRERMELLRSEREGRGERSLEEGPWEGERKII